MTFSVSARQTGGQFAKVISNMVSIIILEKDHNPKLQVEPCARKHHQKRHHKGEAPLIKNPSGVAKYGAEISIDQFEFIFEVLKIF